MDKCPVGIVSEMSAVFLRGDRRGIFQGEMFWGVWGELCGESVPILKQDVNDFRKVVIRCSIEGRTCELAIANPTP